MSTTNGIGGTSSSATNGSAAASSSSTSTKGGLGALTPDDFMKMLIKQLQNQDPLNPTNSDQILQQISQIDNIQATASLTTSLNTVATDQGFATASSLIGKQIAGVDSAGNPVSGTVDSASFAKGAASLHVGSQTLPISSISSVSGPSSTSNVLSGLTGS